MKRIVVLCTVSAILGGMVAMVIRDPTASPSQADPQVPGAAAEPRLDPGQPPPPPRPPLAEMPATGLDGPGRAPVLASDLDQLTPEERVNIAVYETAKNSVVNITTTGFRSERMFFADAPSQGEGSGAVIDRLGHVLTNNHVVEDAEKIEITLFNSKTYEGKVVGRDRDTDIAVVKIDAPAEELFPVTFGDSTRLRVGQRVFALGNPFGFERTLSTGIVASLDRLIPSRSGRKMRQIIQIDASINPGSSGGPLLDSRARMIGMNTAIASKTGESAGVGFAIPASTISRIVPQLMKHGRVIRPDTGIERVIPTEQGLLVATMAPDGPAKRAGLQGPRVVRKQKRQGPLVYEYRAIDPSSADLIVSVDGQRVKTVDDFLTIIEAKQPGDQVALGILRNGRETAVPLVLDASGQ
jgi:S1-C subfamily serine protease